MREREGERERGRERESNHESEKTFLLKTFRRKSSTVKIIYDCSSKNGLNDPCSSTSFNFMSKIVESVEVKNKVVLWFYIRHPFFSKCTFLRLRHFITTCTDPINPIFLVVV